MAIVIVVVFFVWARFLLERWISWLIGEEFDLFDMHNLPMDMKSPHRKRG